MKKTILTILITMCAMPLTFAQNNDEKTTNPSRTQKLQHCTPVNNEKNPTQNRAKKLQHCTPANSDYKKFDRNQNFHKCTQENVQKLRIAYVTSKLNLTVQQSEKFWPINNQYVKELTELAKERKSIMVAVRSDKAEGNAVKQWLDLEQKEIKIKTNYAKQLEKVLPEKQIMKAFVIEERFKQDLVRNYHIHKNNNHHKQHAR